MTNSNGPGGARQFLTFIVAEEEYGVDILRVQEIKGYTRITPIPNVPPHTCGVINLRGAVVPVMDLRVRFGFEAAPHGKFTVIILVSSGARTVGMVVDAVSDVVELADGTIGAPPDLGGAIDTSLLTGIAHAGERMITLLDIDRVAQFGAHGAAPALPRPAVVSEEQDAR